MTVQKHCQHETSRSGAVRLCQGVATVKWHDCASFCVVETVIQIVSVTEGTELLEQSSLAFHCHICCFISHSAVKFPCHITVVDVLNSTYVVLIIKCVFILKMVFSSVFDTVFTVVEKCVILNAM